MKSEENMAIARSRMFLTILLLLFSTSTVVHAQSLTSDDVRRIVAQAAAQAQAGGLAARIAVLDKDGNILGLFKMPGSTSNLTIDPIHGQNGLVCPDGLVSKIPGVDVSD